MVEKILCQYVQGVVTAEQHMVCGTLHTRVEPRKGRNRDNDGGEIRTNIQNNVSLLKCLFSRIRFRHSYSLLGV